MSAIKRPPAIEAGLSARFAAIPKADWAELYRDLWIACNGEDVYQADPEAWMKDAETRRDILKNYRGQQS